MSARARARAQAADHLVALAGPLHPVMPPVWDWPRRAWVWIPPGGTQEEEIGADWQAVQVALERIAQRVRCHHGAPIAGPCAQCRAGVAEQMAA